jgi:protein-S-isoprenylcysteine O-methyltransferase Ste14
MRNPIRLKNLSLRLAPLYVAAILLIALSEIRWPALCLGALPIAAGLLLRSWGAGHLVKNERFTVSGPYAHLRHPLYLGTLLVGLGYALTLGGWASLVGLALVLPWFFLSYFPRKERVEAERLESLYGADFARYRDEVPALLPRLEAWQPAADGLDVQVAAPRWSPRCWDANNEQGTVLAVTGGVALMALRAALG